MLFPFSFMQSQFSYDADAQAFFNRVTAAGGSLTNTEKNAVNTLVIDMKAASIWTLMKAIYPMVGASAAACSQNLKSSSYTGTFSSGWTFASTGVTPNGVSAIMNTGLNLLTTYGTTFNNHFSLYYRTNNTGVFKVGAVQVPNPYDGISAHINYANGNTYNDNMGRNLIANTTYGNSAAFHLSSVLSTTSQKMYRNGSVKISGNATTSAVYPNLTFWIGGCNGLGQYDNRNCAFGSLGDGLTDTEASNFYTAVQAFQTTLSRQV